MKLTQTQMDDISDALSMRSLAETRAAREAHAKGLDGLAWECLSSAARCDNIALRLRYHETVAPEDCTL